MAQGNQDPPNGKLSYIKNPDGTLRRAKADEQPPQVEQGERYVTARMEGNKVSLRVGATAIVDGERTVNASFELNDPALVKAVKEALTEVLDAVGDVAMREAMRDANADPTHKPVMEEE